MPPPLTHPPTRRRGRAGAAHTLLYARRGRGERAGGPHALWAGAAPPARHLPRAGHTVRVAQGGLCWCEVWRGVGGRERGCVRAPPPHPPPPLNAAAWSLSSRLQTRAGCPGSMAGRASTFTQSCHCPCCDGACAGSLRPPPPAGPTPPHPPPPPVPKHNPSIPPPRTCLQRMPWCVHYPPPVPVGPRLCVCLPARAPAPLSSLVAPRTCPPPLPPCHVPSTLSCYPLQPARIHTRGGGRARAAHFWGWKLPLRAGPQRGCMQAAGRAPRTPHFARCCPAHTHTHPPRS